MKQKLYLNLAMMFTLFIGTSAFAQSTKKFTHEITIDCEQVKTAKMTSESTISGVVRNIDVTFPHKTRINPKKGAIIDFKAPGYNAYKLMIPPGGFESEFMLHFTENPREMSRLKPTPKPVAPVDDASKKEVDALKKEVAALKKDAEESKQQSSDLSMPKGEAQKAVSRDTPGQTALEQTIIRWAIDSDPQGARVFWRVISSVPAQVKNTNETYLMTTPYEETRSFNILGLTYENSRDVQIEIKIVKNGYHTQVKRFNVRQAIDQQEISAFFMLVKQDE